MLIFLINTLLILVNIFIYLLERERERSIDLLFHLFIHSLVDSCMCPDQGSNTQPWHIGTMLKPIELPGQGNFSENLLAGLNFSLSGLWGLSCTLLLITLSGISENSFLCSLSLSPYK